MPVLTNPPLSESDISGNVLHKTAAYLRAGGGGNPDGTVDIVIGNTLYKNCRFLPEVALNAFEFEFERPI